MFDVKILDKLIGLNIHTITETIKEVKSAKGVYPIHTIPISVHLPYFFMTLYDDSQLDKLIRGSGVVGYITVNGITTLILYLPNPEKQNMFLPILNIKDNNLNYFVSDNLTLQHTDKITIFHKDFKRKDGAKTAKVSIIDSIAELSQKPNNIFYADYSKKHPCFYFYKQPLTRKIFSKFKGFKLYCTFLFIAEKSNIIKHKRTQCHICPKDLMAIIPNCYKYRRPKGNSLKPKERKSYSKSYITFLKIACKVGIVKDFQLVDEYISITFTETFMKELSEPPYIKIPFSLLNDITTNNYQFIMYFINRLFSLKPSTPHFVNIKIKELLKVTGISTSTSQTMAVKRLNSYLGILEKYQIISEQITYIAEDIRKNKLLRFRLNHFKHLSLSSIDEEYLDDEGYYL